MSRVVLLLLPIVGGCAPDTGDDGALGSESGSESEGDGDGDGDGDTTGDGDGDGEPGDGDGDGDGDGESVCGNGVVEGSEVCDDGNPDDTDDCPSSCEPASCGDGFVWADNEDCDDANDIDTDSCLQGCIAASCGDGVVWDGFEVCDDGNDIDTDDCLQGCAVAYCGDGVVWAGNEECDDANDLDNDGCDSGCTLTVGIRKVSAGYEHTCALSWTGEVKCWGAGGLGRLGQGNTTTVLSPLDIDPVATGPDLVVDVFAGSTHTCVVYDNQTMRCWGSNAFGHLGQGNTVDIGDNELPDSIPTIDLGGDVAKVDTGYARVCALLSDGGVRCWGSGMFGLGYGNPNNVGDDETPSAAGDINIGGGTVIDITLGAYHTCVLTDQGEVRCWGANDDGQLGYGNTVQIGDNEPPAQVGYVQTGDGVVQIEAGGHHTCARYDDGTLRCWGNGAMGQLGYGNTNFIGNNELPNSVGTVDVGGFVHDVMCKLEETCALLDGGEIRCWGAGNFGQLGYGNTLNIGNDELPSSVGVVQVGAAVATLTESTAQFHVCVLTTANNIRCWGNGADGRLGYGNVNNVGNNEVPSFVGDVPY